SSARDRCPARRIERPKWPVSRIAGRQLAVSASEMSTWGGVAEIEQHALIVNPQSRSPFLAVTITTPPARTRIAALHASRLTAEGTSGATLKALSASIVP